ncbi:MAG: RNA polymerase sigma-70 factor [Prevotellaceae bacterium]|nr:RNA polymerase sigma-70 factor [Prevotellaceae bacterium]
MEHFKQLYEQYAPALIFYARKFTDYQTAEDVVHDVFIRIWKRDLTLPDDDGMGAYLFRAVHNACRDHLKRQAVRSSYMSRAAVAMKEEELAFYDNPLNQMMNEERQAALGKAIGALPDKCREVFRLAYLEEKHHSEIAALLNISVRTVEAQVYKALKMLRSALMGVVAWVAAISSFAFLIVIISTWKN